MFMLQRSHDRTGMMLLALVIVLAMVFPDAFGRAYAVLEGLLPLIVFWMIWKIATLESSIRTLRESTDQRATE